MTPTKPRITVATRTFTPEPIPAAFREESLAAALADAGAEVTVLTSASALQRHSTHQATEHGVLDIRRAPVKRDKLGMVRGYVSYLSFDVPLLLRLLLRRRPDAIVVEPPPTTGLVVTAVSALLRVPFAFFAADVWADATESVPAPRVVKRLVRWAETTAWRRAAAVLAISEGVADRVRELVPSARVVTIGNGADTDTFTAEGAGHPELGPYAVYAGTVSEWQGAGVFLDAFARVREQVPDARLLFFSEGTGRDALERRVRDEGIAGVEFHDRIPARAMAAYLRSAACGLSSIVPGLGYEFALPTKIYAATACGCPVVHAGTGAARERIEENDLGWGVDYEAGAVAAAMLAAFRGEERPDPDRLREWTVENASLRASATRGAAAVMDVAADRPHS